MSQKVYDYQNQVLGNKEHFQNGLYQDETEGFSYLNEDIILSAKEASTSRLNDIIPPNAL